MDQYLSGWCKAAGLDEGRVAGLIGALGALPGPKLELLLQVENDETGRQTLFLESGAFIVGTNGVGLTHIFHAVPARGPSSIAALLHGYAQALVAYADRKPYKAQGTADVKAVRERAAAILKLADQW